MLKKWRHRKRCKTLAEICGEPVMKQYLEQCAGLDPGHIGDTPLISAGCIRLLYCQLSPLQHLDAEWGQV